VIARLCGTVLIGLIVPAPASFADPPGARFTAAIATRETLRFDRNRCPAPPYLVGTTIGNGSSTPFGPILGRGSDCVRPINARAFSFSRGKLTLTTSDGDSLYADYSGRLARSPKLRIDAIFGDFHITGGTGRFTGASGNGSITGNEDLLTRRGQLVLEGTIAQ
jgi:hypothetical protein